ncbi:uncharacterized protein LOC110860925 isoform X2 [Folsomia candida]|uniref:uncharacterized protein LOC110860925 isoform X2 n=1 Tax=Folsomia candida TaxID=158441 RepID=UPI001604BE2D|nr:uncharacterized protein LOC110860925 isoform X2 [Folsomia candida]
MPTTRGKKRPREVSITQKFMEQNFHAEIGESRKYFIRTEPESSLTKKTGTEHVIYYQPFLNYDLVITQIPNELANYKGVFEIKIQPVAWATAFNQRDLDSTTKFVMKSIVHTECLRIISNDTTAKCNTVKIIERAVVFMMSKFIPNSNINPWSFPSTFDKIMIQFPLLDDKTTSDIASVLRNFDPRFEHDTPSQSCELNDRMDIIVGGFWDNCNIPENYNELLVNVSREETKYDQMFRKCVNAVRNSGNLADMKMDTAQIAAALTKSTITQNTDQIVDSIQFSQERWTAAFKCGSTSIAKIAAKLSSTLIRIQFCDTVEIMESFTGVESLCPVQMLAIYRASKFLHDRRDVKHGYVEMYDSQIPAHNVYPTIEECIEIDKEIRLHGRNDVLGRLRDLAQGQMVTTVDQVIPSPSSGGQAIPCTLPIIQPQGLPNSCGTPVQPMIQNFGNIPITNLPSPFEIDGLINLGVDNIKQNPGIIEVSPRPHDDANFNLVELPHNKEELRLLKRTGALNGIEPILLVDSYPGQSYISLTIQYPLKLGDGTIQEVKRSHAISKVLWTSIESLYKTNGPIHMGRRLITNIFDEDELRDATPTGRRMKGQPNTERKQLDEEKQWLIIDVIRYLTSRGIDFVSKPDYYHGPWSPSVEKDMRNEVICYGSNKIRGDLKKLGR